MIDLNLKGERIFLQNFKIIQLLLQKMINDV